MKKLSIILIVIGCLISQVNATNLILNGSFENGSYPGSFITVIPGQNKIDHWNVTSGSVDYIGSYWNASDGTRSIDMSGNQAGTLTISQAINLTVGTQYIVTFDMAGNPAGGPQIKSMDVGIDSYLGNFSFDTAGKSTTNMGWQAQSFSFIALSTTANLQFISKTGTAYGPALDNVKMSVVPEPGTFLLLGAGLLGLVAIGYKRREKN